MRGVDEGAARRVVLPRLRMAPAGGRPGFVALDALLFRVDSLEDGGIGHALLIRDVELPGGRRASVAELATAAAGGR